MLLLWLLFNSSDVSALNIEFFWFILWSLQILVFLLIFAGETSWIKHQFSLFSGVVGVGGFVLVGCIQVCVCVCVGVSGLRLSVMAQNFLSNWVKEDIKVGRGGFWGSGVLVNNLSFFFDLIGHTMEKMVENGAGEKRRVPILP